jgi:hypothetical protein
MAEPDYTGIRGRLFTIQDEIVDSGKRILFCNILGKLIKIEKELGGVSRLQLTHVSREQKKIHDGVLATPEEEARSAAIIKHWKRVHNSHWENNFNLLHQELDVEHARIAGLKDEELELALRDECEYLSDALTILYNEYTSVQSFKKAIK